MIKVFISFKNTFNNSPTRDSEIARQLYSFLKAKGIDVFMSNSSLCEHGAADYKEIIDGALDQATHLILIATKEEYIKSPWVKYEWETFFQDLISAEKEGELFCIFENDITNIPRSLKYKQRFLPSNEGFQQLYAFITAKEKKVVNDKRIFVCSRCGKIFDKGSVDGCSYHPESPIVVEEKNFRGEIKKYWWYPCCNSKYDYNTDKSMHNGCVLGKHIIK